jgi:tetratricopeptide (TPR) repeat protein
MRQAAQVWADAVADAQRQEPPDEQRISRYRGNQVQVFHQGELWDDLVTFWRTLLDQARTAGTSQPVLDDLRDRLAGAQLQAGQEAAAIEALRQAVADARSGGDPGRVDASLEHLADAYDRVGRYEDALGILRQRYPETRDRFGPADQHTIRAGRDLAAAEFRNRDYAAAIALLHDLSTPTVAPRLRATVHHDLGCTLLFDDQVAAAEAELQQAVEHADAQHRQLFAATSSVVLRLLGRLPEAETVLRSHGRWPPRDEHRAVLAHALFLQGRFDDAERLLGDDTPDLQASWLQALLALARKDDAAAVRKSVTAARHYADRWQMMHLIAWSEDGGPLPEAETAVALDPRGKPGYYVPPFSRAETAALTLCLAGRAGDGARLLERAAPRRLPGERWHRPVYDLLTERTGVDLGDLREIWQRIQQQDPQCTLPWPSEDS